MLRAQRIVATGEDTTIALAALVAAQANLPLAVVPQGGVYGNQAGLSYDVSEAIHLAAAGLLSRKVGGPSVFPPLPPDVAALSYANNFKWTNSTGEDR